METQKPISPLRQRMTDDMRVRKLGEKTQYHYLRAVRQFAKYLGRSPDTASVEDLRNYQLHLVDYGVSPASLNSAISGLKFFFSVTLDRPEAMAKMQPVHLPRKTLAGPPVLYIITVFKESAMSAPPIRFICPHCHTPIDPERMETAINGRTEYRICPECDEAIVFARSELPTASGELISSDGPDGPPPERAPIQPTEACHP